ncbi:MAG: PD-(D/E)XK nuclease family transposase, partial [Parabacteroides sp.]
GDVLHEIYLEMPKFQLPLSQCDTIHKKLLYVLTHMDVLNRMPQELNNQIFQKLKHIASMSRMSPDEMLAYQMSLMNDYAYMDSLHTEREEGIKIGEERGLKVGKAEGIKIGEERGRKEGKAEGKTEMAAEMKRRGMDWVTIAEISGLSLEEVKAL